MKFPKLIDSDRPIDIMIARACWENYIPFFFEGGIDESKFYLPVHDVNIHVATGVFLDLSVLDDRKGSILVIGEKGAAAFTQLLRRGQYHGITDEAEEANINLNIQGPSEASGGRELPRVVVVSDAYPNRSSQNRSWSEVGSALSRFGESVAKLVKRPKHTGR